MKKNQYLYISIFAITILIIGSYYFVSYSDKNNLTELKAISILKNTYPEFKDYPNDNLPPQRIQTEKDKNGRYVAFVQLGSGRYLIGAKCYFVNYDKSIRIIGIFTPSIDDKVFSIKTCAK